MNPTSQALDLRQYIRDIADFPKPGILFKDITPLLADGPAFRQAIKRMADHYRGQPIDVVVAAEARGFLFAAPLAVELGIGIVPIRKPGKLPYTRRSYTYDLEYGSDTLEMHIDGLAKGDRVLVVDDVLATGGTVAACLRMVKESGATVVGCAFLIELSFLGGAARLGEHPVFSLIQYKS